MIKTEKTPNLRKTLLFASAFAMCLCAMLLIFGVKAGAETAIQWDGKSPIEDDKVYLITDSVYINKSVTIPSGAKLSVRKGAEFKLYPNAKLNVYGELAVAVEGYMKNSGNINIKPGGIFNIYGTVESSVSGIIDISGNTTIYNKGVFLTSSAMRIYKTAKITDKGVLSFYKSSDVRMSGIINSVEGSDLELRGIMSMTVSSVVTVGGHLTIGAASNVKCSGKIFLDETATYTRFKSIIMTKSGVLSDSRPTYEYNDMTVDILIDEPDVKLRGIDVSWAQAEIDWEKVAASGLDFVIIRAGRGRAGSNNEMKEDDRFRENIEQAHRYGLNVGVYFYSYAMTAAEAAEEAQFFIDIIKDYEIEYPVILDMEETFQGNIGKKKLTNMINAFFEVIMNNGFFPMFYSYKAWIEQYLDMTVLDKYAVWLAQVSDEVTYDGGYYIWQYSFTGKVSGIKGDVDLDISYKNWPEILSKYGLNNLKPR